MGQANALCTLRESSRSGHGRVAHAKSSECWNCVDLCSEKAATALAATAATAAASAACLCDVKKLPASAAALAHVVYRGRTCACVCQRGILGCYPLPAPLPRLKCSPPLSLSLFLSTAWARATHAWRRWRPSGARDVFVIQQRLNFAPSACCPRNERALIASSL